MNIPPMPAPFRLYDDDGVPSGISVTDLENWGRDGWSAAMNAVDDERERCRAAITNWIELHDVDHLTGPELDSLIRRALEPRP